MVELNGIKIHPNIIYYKWYVWLYLH